MTAQLQAAVVAPTLGLETGRKLADVMQEDKGGKAADFRSRWRSSTSGDETPHEQRLLKQSLEDRSDVC
jgi:hypothetical protein